MQSEHDDVMKNECIQNHDGCSLGLDDGVYL
jgi:hypothetical protein